MADAHSTASAGDDTKDDQRLDSTLAEQPLREPSPLEVNAPQPAAIADPHPEKQHRAFSVFTPVQKRWIIIAAGIAAFFSPVTGQIYFPSLNVMAEDLHVSNTLINLTVTTYLIFQGLAPSFTGALSDQAGRRPAYLICFIIYMAANIGLGIQDNYAALLVLRCVQSAGSSGTVALATAVAADLCTSSERGKYVSYMSAPAYVGPAIGPIIGGLLAKYLGWHSIFWFLLIVAGVVFVPFALFFPETCRSVVGNGSVPPPNFSKTYTNRIIVKQIKPEDQEESLEKVTIKFPNPFQSVKIILTKEAGFVLVYVGLVFSALYATMALIPSTFGDKYGFNEIQIALCYIPFGCGTVLSSFVRGRFIDARFKHHADRLGIKLDKTRKMDMLDFPIERARIEAALPTIFAAGFFMIGFGWMVQYSVNLAGPLIFLFVLGFSISGSMNSIATLLIDVFPDKAATATAANNLCRCWLGAAATGFVDPMIDAVGVGWTTTLFGLLILGFSPVLWYVMANGPKWRRESYERRKEAAARAAEKAEAKV